MTTQSALLTGINALFFTFIAGFCFGGLVLEV